MNASAPGWHRWLRGSAPLAAVLLALVVPALRDLGYRVSDPELQAFAAGAIATGALLALLTGRWPLLQRLLVALLLACVLDSYFLGPWYGVLLVAAGLFALVASRFHTAVLNVSSLCAGIFALLGAISPRPGLLEPAIDTPGQRAGASASLPLLLHVVLDEQASPLTATPGSAAADRAQAMLDAYVQRGFAARVSVRAEAGATELSLSRVFGPAGVPSDAGNLLGSAGGYTHRLGRNDLMRNLQARGFDVSVIQNSFLQLCVEPAAHCHTYSRDNYGHAMRRYKGALGSRLRLAAALLHVEMLQEDVRGVFLYRPFGELAIRSRWFHADPDRNYWTRTAAMLELFDVLDAREPSLDKGEAWIIHVLLPHFPYILDADCGLRPYGDWSLPAWVSERMPLPHVTRRLEDDYWRQVECTHRRVLSLVDRLDRRLGAGNLRVLVHGDHGARLGLKGSRPKPGQLEADAPDPALDTVVLVRGPGVAPGVDAARLRLPDAIRDSYTQLLR